MNLPIEPEKIKQLIADLEAEANEDKLASYKPYLKQVEFHAAGAKHRERLLMAGNQLGKTLAGAMEIAIHATGRYPAWWRGKRFDKPTISWVAGTTGETVRDTVQRMLIGRPGQEGTGTVPKDAIVELVPARGIADLLDGIKLRRLNYWHQELFARPRILPGRDPRFPLVRRRTAAGRVPGRPNQDERIAWPGVADIYAPDRHFDRGETLPDGAIAGSQRHDNDD